MLHNLYSTGALAINLGVDKPTTFKHELRLVAEANKLIRKYVIEWSFVKHRRFVVSVCKRITEYASY